MAASLARLGAQSALPTASSVARVTGRAPSQGAARQRAMCRPVAHSARRSLAASASPSQPATGPSRPAGSPGIGEEEQVKDTEGKEVEVDGLKMESWGLCIDAMKKESSVTILLTRYNSSGFNAKCFGVTGFIPYSLMDPTKLPAKGAADAVSKMREMLGLNLTAKIVEADMASGRLIFSEIACKTKQLLQSIAVGQEFDAVVRTITDFGAFVDLKDDAGQLTGAAGLVHKSELSWESVAVTSAVVKPGMNVRVKVMDVDTERGRLALSMKQCQADPAMANLDTMLPIEEDPSVVWEESSGLLPGLEDILRELRKDDNILLVTPGRQAELPRVVAQDLQIFMTKEQVADGYNLVARSGSRVQEVVITTDLSRQEMVKVLTAAVKKIS